MQSQKTEKLHHQYTDVTLRILHYDFAGPIPVSDWGPPMAKAIYILLARSRDRFIIIYADDCEDTNKIDYLTGNPLFGKWVRAAGGERNLYICALALPNSDAARRARIVSKIVATYKPVCNTDDP